MNRFSTLKPWLLPLGMLLLAVIAALTLWGKMRKDVWAYYTDGEGLKADANEEKVRAVLWQDPQLQSFDEKEKGTATLEAEFSADGTTMVLVRDGDLFLSNWDGRIWSKLEPIKSVNTESGERSPALSRDGQYLYFASDRKGGSGGFDIYVARRNGSEWGNVEVLPKSVNSSSNELGPALSADDSQLYFSSDRDGEGSEDIYVSSITLPKRENQTRPDFALAVAVDDLNSKAADVQAALSGQGDHVFLASDRDRDNKAGFKVYISRVKDGEVMRPEEVDLYIDEGDVTDPAVRMDGFDLLFSKGGGESEPELYRSTTREVVGYTDLSRWEQFKQVLRNIAWWILLALVGLIALIYILEKWNDITSLFHKCLAGSAAMHLIALVLAMLWLIAREIEIEKPTKSEDVVVNIDALAEEDLAMESIPEETDLSDTTTNVESEKVESEFGAPGFEPQEDAQPVPDAAKTAKEAVPVEVQPAMADASDQPVPKPVEESSVLSELAATVLPDVDTPMLEERDPNESQPVADASNEVFEPQEMTQETEKTEMTDVADSAVETAVSAAQVTELHEPEPLMESPKESVVEAQPNETPTEMPSEQTPLESAMLSDLEPAQFTDPSVTPLEETNPAVAQNADPSKEMFSTESTVPNLETAPSQSEAVSDSAMSESADAASVASSETVADSPAMDGAPSVVSESAADSDLPPAEMGSGAPAALPDLALADPGSPMLEEPGQDAPGAPADTSSDLFQPSASAPSLATAPSSSASVSDTAVSEMAPATAVAASESVNADTAMEAKASESISEMPPTEISSGAPSALPDLALVDPGAPTLEEPGNQPAADPSADVFKPSQAAPNLSTAPAKGSMVADSAVAAQADSAAVNPAERVTESPVRPSEIAAAATPVDMVGSPLAPPALPDATLIDPGEAKLEEPSKQPAGAPADMAKDQFKPGDNLPKLAQAQSTNKKVPDAAKATPSQSTEIPQSSLVATSAVKESHPPERIDAATPLPSPEETPPGGLPELAMIDPGSPKLEEPDRGKGAPADTPAEEFKATGIPGLTTTQTSGSTVADSAVAEPIGSGAIAAATRDSAASDIPPNPNQTEAAGSMPKLDSGASTELGAATAMTGLLPEKLDAPEKMGDPKGMADIVKKVRGKPGMETIKQMGGSEGTEGAIGAAMEWLVKNQEADGRWDTQKHGSNQNYDSGGTGLVLLCFYGWGERHDTKCKYQTNVKKALDWMVANQNKENGYLGSRAGMMYSHAIGTIALCEAYGVTKDNRLKGPAERAIAYTLAAQSKSRGGWRYSPGEDSDTSVTGWQYMALHSARMAGIEVPEEAFERARGFLDKMSSGKNGGNYGYHAPAEISRAMVATGMFCRQLDLVPPSDPRMQESANVLKRNPMKLPKPDLYYIYYATLSLYQHQGPIWQEWNKKLEKELPLLQKTTGNESGSWDPSSSVTGDGGRVVSTALATLSLEVYYRLLPMYGFRNTEADAPEVKQR
jgi:hypothetical protein